MAKKLTEDAVRDKARDILGFKDKVYVFEADKMIQGFVGLNDEYI